MEIPCKPFTILAIGPFAPAPRETYQVKMVPVDTPNETLALLRPALWVPVPRQVCPEGGVTISPGKLRDLTPDGMLESASYVKDLSDARAFIQRSSSGDTSVALIVDEVRSRWPHLPLDLSFETGARKAPQKSKVDDILSMVAMGTETAASTPAAQPAPTTATTVKAEAVVEHTATPGAVTGKTTFKELKEWGLSEEKIKSVTDGKIGPDSAVIKDWAAANGLTFSELKVKLQDLYAAK